jgi:serine/threonine protein kinase
MSEGKHSEGKGDGGDGSHMESTWRNIEYDDVQIGDRIGGGGVGIIYNGWFRNEPVALKTLFDSRVSEDLKKEYMDELIIMSKVNHSNIVNFIGACMTPPNYFFVMELCSCSLYDMLHNQRDSISDKDIVRMATDIASAMEYLHAQRPAIVHRDLKSHNVLRGNDGSMKLCDFGLVKVKTTQAGTPSYMAPELFENRPFNKSVDVYAFGILMWEIYTRDIPFYLCDIIEIRRKVMNGDRPRMPGAGAHMGPYTDLLRECWQPDADARPTFTQCVDVLLDMDAQVPESKYSESLSQASGGDTLDSLLSHK